MEKIVKVVEMSLSRLNNAEYTRFLSAVEKMVEKATPPALGISRELFNGYADNIQKLTEIGNQSRTSDETAELEALDKARDARLVYILNTIRNERQSPNPEQKKAAVSLYNLLHTYAGMQALPNGQETQTVDDLLKDVARGENAANLAALKLQDALDELESLNEHFKTLSTSRSEGQVARYVDNAKNLRAQTDAQYDEIETRAFAESVAKPSAITREFILNLNKLKNETKAANHQRGAKKPDDGKTPPAKDKAE